MTVTSANMRNHAANARADDLVDGTEQRGWHGARVGANAEQRAEFAEEVHRMEEENPKATEKSLADLENERIPTIWNKIGSWIYLRELTSPEMKEFSEQKSEDPCGA